MPEHIIDHEAISRRAAALILVGLPPDFTRVAIPGGAGYLIREQAIPEIAIILQSTIANVVATIIDAGSERDAVNENTDLFDAIQDELRGWSTNPQS